MITISGETIGLLLGITSLIGVMFAVYLHFRNPQIKSDVDMVKIKEDIKTLETTIREVREKHLHAVEQDMKRLTSTIGQLSTTVTRLSTIIDERIPRQNLTP